jgi:tetratricopeptide (TPR) repeat protein
MRLPGQQMSNPDQNKEIKQAAASQPALKTARDYDPYIGTLLDERYEVNEFLGAGAWGNVYRGKHLTLGVDIAVKILHRHLINDKGGMQRLQQEAQLLSRLESPYVVRIMDYGLQPAPYIAMEFFDGMPLDKWLSSKGFLKANFALELFRQICLGLVNAHAMGFIHRDLKPSNIMLKIEDGQLKSKILDFGIARLVDLPERLTGTGEILGSPPYMPPEQWSGQTDNRSDIYSLGCIMYEVLTLKPPFRAEYGMEYVVKHISDTPPRLKDATPEADFPASLEDLVFKCLAKAPEQRYQSAKEVLAELERVKSGQKLQIQLNKERRCRQHRLLISGSLAVAGTAALLFWQREAILSPWFNHFNALGDQQMAQCRYRQSASAYRTSLLAAGLLPAQQKSSLHAMRMLSICLTQEKQFQEAGKLRRQIDEASGAGPWPELTSALRRVEYRLIFGSDLKDTLDLAQRAVKMAAGFAGQHSLAYAEALNHLASVNRARGDFRQACSEASQAISIAGDLLEPDSIALASTLNNAGQTFRAAGKLGEAEKAYLRALQISSAKISSKAAPGQSPGKGSTPLILADFNNGTRLNNVGGELGTWEKDISDKTQGTKISFAADDAVGLPGAKSLELDYDVDSPNQAFTGFWMKLASQDFSSYDTLNLYLKGDAAKGFSTRLKIELKDFTNKPSPYLIDGIESGWQKFSVPFNSFKLISDWSRMNEFVVGFEDVVSKPKAGRILLDQVFVTFENQAESKNAALAQFVNACQGLAATRCLRQDRQGALASLQTAYRLCKSHTEIDSLAVLASLASFFDDEGDSARALQYWKGALDIVRQDGRYQCPDTEFILSGLARIYYDLKDYRQAEAYLDEACKLRELSQGEPGRLKFVLVNLIRAKKALGKTTEVAELDKRLREVSTTVPAR